jgi:F420H(2)-dependent quinone reductase
MGRVESPAVRGSWLGTLLRVVNPIVRVVLASPVHWILSRWFLLLSWTGQKSGQARSTPVSYVTDDVGTWVTTGDRWPDYVIGNPTLRVRMRGRWSPARAVLIDDEAQSLREHTRIFTEHRWFRFLAGIPARHGVPHDTAIATAMQAGRKLIRVDRQI